MRLQSGTDGPAHEFQPVPLTFEAARHKNLFARKNNKTLAQTLVHLRYAKLTPEVTSRYRASLGRPLGEFLMDLKRRQDRFYTRFLNRYGDLEYSVFYISEGRYLNSKGVYAYIAENEVKYIGRCKVSMKKRINQGYGMIHPKNCYRDGQATNCHLNALITASRDEISLWLCPMDDEQEIVATEHHFIRAYEPPWNIQRP